MLASRTPGLNGTHVEISYTAAAISGNGRVVAFASEDENLVPGTGPWPLGMDQVVTRVLSNGKNSLASRSKGGAVANAGADSVSLNRDGSQVAFEANSTNLLPAHGGNNRSAVFVKNMKTGKLRWHLPPSGCSTATHSPGQAELRSVTTAAASPLSPTVTTGSVAIAAT